MSTFNASFAATPYGLHPTLHLSLAPAEPPAPSSCSLWLHLSIPRTLIADRFQLQQLHLSGALGAADLSTGGRGSFVLEGEDDIEVPEWRAAPAALWVRLDGPGPSGGKGKAREVDVPLHLRYLEPVERRWSDDGRRLDIVDVEGPVPSVFWACPEDEPYASCAPDTLPPPPSLHSLASSRLRFVPSNASLAALCPPPPPPPLILRAPAGALEDLPLVEGVTGASVWLCFAFLAWTAVRTWLRTRDGRVKVKTG
ncbi:Pbn1p [Rhodotorula paludigena]|uniref:Pbn1p n=1 Tax=Rhodotorula paludigena TaxID=86838 RepID=UPI00317DAFA4